MIEKITLTIPKILSVIRLFPEVVPFYYIQNMQVTE